MSAPVPPPQAGPAYLTDAQRDALVTLLGAAVLGTLPNVREAATRALLEGLAPSALREALLLVVPYAGFPRALAACGAARAALAQGCDGAGDVPADERSGRGRAAFEAVYGATSGRVLEGLGALDPLLPAWTLEFAYGRVIARSGLSLRDRELLAVAMLAALGTLADPLLGHMRGALRLGATHQDLEGVLAALLPLLGPAPVEQARAVLARR